MASGAIAGVGTRFQKWDGMQWLSIAEVTSISDFTVSRDMIDITTVDSPEGFREYAGDFPTGGTVMLSMNFTRSTYELMYDDFLVKQHNYYRILLPETVINNDSLDAASDFAFNGFVVELGLDVVADDKITSTVGIKMTNKVGAFVDYVEDEPPEEESYDDDWLYVTEGLVWYRKGIREGMYVIDRSADGGNTWVLNLVQLVPTEDVIIITVDDNPPGYRQLVRGGAYVIDYELDATGFSGTENVNWVNVFNTNIP